ncbi:hypothetical protein BHU11_02080 [Tannerella sp. oral taxon 808]|nr:hypothetical protein BHU11_02080 [Tannerella sp. oral taxon 808]
MKKYATDLQLGHIALKSSHVGSIELRVGDNHDQLADALVISHGTIDRVDPAVHLFAVGLAKEGGFMLRCGCDRGEGQTEGDQQGN